MRTTWEVKDFQEEMCKEKGQGNLYGKKHFHTASDTKLRSVVQFQTILAVAADLASASSPLFSRGKGCPCFLLARQQCAHTPTIRNQSLKYRQTLKRRNAANKNQFPLCTCQRNIQTM